MAGGDCAVLKISLDGMSDPFIEAQVCKMKHNLSLRFKSITATFSISKKMREISEKTNSPLDKNRTCVL
jgi:hypothetical protein